MTRAPGNGLGRGRNDLALMRAGRGDWVTKIGAEGVQAIGIRSRGWGIAIKVADGNARGLHPATVAVLDQLGLLDDARRAALARLGATGGRATTAASSPATIAAGWLSWTSGRLRRTDAGRRSPGRRELPPRANGLFVQACAAGVDRVRLRPGGARQLPAAAPAVRRA